MTMFEELIQEVRVLDEYSLKDYTEFEILEENIEWVSEKAVKLKDTKWIPFSQLAIDTDDNFFITHWFYDKIK